MFPYANGVGRAEPGGFRGTDTGMDPGLSALISHSPALSRSCMRHRVAIERRWESEKDHLKKLDDRFHTDASSLDHLVEACRRLEENKFSLVPLDPPKNNQKSVEMILGDRWPM
jgi:hypothetical protein